MARTTFLPKRDDEAARIFQWMLHSIVHAMPHDIFDMYWPTLPLERPQPVALKPGRKTGPKS